MHQELRELDEQYHPLDAILSNMEVPSTVFEALLVLIILQTAMAVIPDCDFSETVNISSSQMLSNGSYLYKDILVPENMTGEYNYIRSEYGLMEVVPAHLRGCVCQLKPCIWMCCLHKDWQDNSECSDGLMKTLTEINPFLNVTLANKSVVTKNLLTDFIVLRDPLRQKDYWTDDVYTIYENGSVWSRKYPSVVFRGYDCFHPNQFSSGSTESFMVAFHHSVFYWEPEAMLPEEVTLIWLSEGCLALTITVYLYVKKLRNLHGKCFICYMIVSFMFLPLSLQPFHPIPLQLCVLNGYALHFFKLKKFAWLLALSHQMWKGFTSVNRFESQHSFLAYSAFVWSTAAILTGFIVLIDHIWGGEPKWVNWIPGVGWGNCYLKAGWSSFVYDYVVLLTLVTLNTVLFLWTTISIIRVKLSLLYFSDQEERARNSTSSEKRSYKMFLRLCIIMDIQWTVRFISQYGSLEHLIRICRYFDESMGIIICVLFILKHSTIRLLIERIRQGSTN